MHLLVHFVLIDLHRLVHREIQTNFLLIKFLMGSSIFPMGFELMTTSISLWFDMPWSLLTIGTFPLLLFHMNIHIIFFLL